MHHHHVIIAATTTINHTTAAAVMNAYIHSYLYILRIFSLQNTVTHISILRNTTPAHCIVDRWPSMTE